MVALTGYLYASAGLISSLFNAFGTQWMLRYWGLGIVLMMSPAAELLGAIGIVSVPCVASAFAGRTFDLTMRWSLNNSAKSLLWIAVAVRLELAAAADSHVPAGLTRLSSTLAAADAARAAGQGQAVDRRHGQEDDDLDHRRCHRRHPRAHRRLAARPRRALARRVLRVLRRVLPHAPALLRQHVEPDHEARAAPLPRPPGRRAAGDTPLGPHPHPHWDPTLTPHAPWSCRSGRPAGRSGAPRGRARRTAATPPTRRRSRSSTTTWRRASCAS